MYYVLWKSFYVECVIFFKDAYEQAGVTFRFLAENAPSF